MRRIVFFICLMAWPLAGTAETSDLHDRLLTFDAHADIPLSFATPENNPGIDGLDPVDLPKMDRGRLDGAAFAIFPTQGPLTDAGYAEAYRQADIKFRALHRMTDELFPDHIDIVRTSDQMAAYAGAEKHFVFISILNAYALGPEAERLQEFYDRGARMIGYTHRGHNQFADSARPNPSLGNEETLHSGLSALGRRLIPELNRMGMIIDVSQISHEALMQTVALTTAPVVASHVGIDALVPGPRNLTDEALLAIKQTGGVVHIVAFDGYLKPTSPERAAAILNLLQRNPRETEQQRADYRRATLEINEQFPGASVADLVDQIDYVVELIGIDHVGVATDFNHGGGISGWIDMADAPNVTAELISRGYSEDEIAKIWGLNFLRVFKEVEKVAADLNE